MQKDRNCKLASSTSYVWLCVGVFVLFVAAFVLYLKAEEETERATEARFQSFRLAGELRQSSDDMTRMARSYVATGNTRFKDHYQEILDIQNGKKPRPVDSYNVYWDLVLADNLRPRPFGPPIPLLDLMRQAGFSPGEMARLEEAKQASDNLSATELAAMALVESSQPTEPSHRALAVYMLHDPLYHEAKSQVMGPIATFYDMVDQRTHAASAAASAKADRMRLVLIVSGVVLMFLLGRLLNRLDQEKEEKSRSEALFHAVFDNATVGLAQLTPGGRFIDINQEFCKIIGYGRDEVLTGNFGFQQITFPEDLPVDLENVTRLLQGQADHYTLEKRYIHKDGHIVWVSLYVYLLKNPDGSPQRFVAAVVDITADKAIHDRLEHLAHHDMLTGMPNRVLFSERVAQSLALAERHHTRFALLQIDLDKFKPINDTYGHALGDKVLQESARRMNACLRESDTVCRIGGDEFVALVNDVQTGQDALTVAEKIRLALNEPMVVHGQTLSIAASIGVALYPEQGRDETTLARNADSALYQAKALGRNQVRLYGEAEAKPVS